MNKLSARKPPAGGRAVVVAPACALLLALLWPLSAGAAEVQRAPVELHYAIAIKPAERQLEITGTLRGYPGGPVRKFAGWDISEEARGKISLRNPKADDGVTVFAYAHPLPQPALKDPRRPFIQDDYFAGICKALLVLPKGEGMAFDRLSLSISAPEGWGIITSRGVGASWELASVKDLMGTMICAGDYSSHGFDLPHTKGGGTTKVHIAIRGERAWDDRELVALLRKMMRTQMDFFGGVHPAPVQFFALHVIPGESAGVPAFNRRTPGHNNVIALLSPGDPKDPFGFIGMLAHEHLHNWVPKAFKADLGPWFDEGLTDYVAYRGLVANGMLSRERLAGKLSGAFKGLLMCIARNDTRTMPYSRGMLAAWVLDIELLRATRGERGLGTVLRKLLDSEPEGGTLRRSHFLAALREVSGRDMEPLYKHLVEDKGVIDLQKHLKGTGFHISYKPVSISIGHETDEEKKMCEAILSKRLGK